ncbi:Ig-like domain-containing protein [Streptomyces sp. NPDC055796]
MNLLLRGQAVGDTPALGTVYAALYTSADPRRGVSPGETIQFGLSVAPDQGAPRGCAYLPEEPLAAVGEIVGVQGLEYFPRQRWFRARADAGQQTTGVLHLRVGDSGTARSIRPRMAVGIPDATGRKLVRTGKLAAEPLPLRRSAPRGLRLVTKPGAPGTVNVLSAAPAASTAVSVTQPRGGRAQLSPDGWVTYAPDPGFTGYDRFEYTIGTVSTGQLTSHVNVFVGFLEHIPGAFPQHPADSTPRAWQWPELTGEMPWPRPSAPQN